MSAHDTHDDDLDDVPDTDAEANEAPDDMTSDDENDAQSEQSESRQYSAAAVRLVEHGLRAITSQVKLLGQRGIIARQAGISEAIERAGSLLPPLLKEDACNKFKLAAKVSDDVDTLYAIHFILKNDLQHGRLRPVLCLTDDRSGVEVRLTFSR